MREFAELPLLLSYSVFLGILFVVHPGAAAQSTAPGTKRNQAEIYSIGKSANRAKLGCHSSLGVYYAGRLSRPRLRGGPANRITQCKHAPFSPRNLLALLLVGVAVALGLFLPVRR